MSNSPLRIEQTGRVLHLTLDRPAKRNALSAELRQCLVAALSAATSDDSVGAVVLCGAGGYFCAGFDLDELAAAADPAELFAAANLYHHTVHTFPKPIVAAIEGFALAGGFDLALMCDLRVTGDEATFGHPQIRHGIPTNFELLASVVTDTTARDLCLTGRRVDTAEALVMGLVHRVVPAGEAMATALALADDIAGLAGSTAMKQTFLADQPDLFPLT